ncbi:MAG TPA: ATP-binding protein [Candidatus Aenigmarchaeota archaeon]|nr:ATP-binding protein [Candidatus Aenigmarchaeota archaeon]
MLDEKPLFLAEFGSDMTYVNMAQNLAREFCTLCGLSEEESKNYSTSVRELTINAIRHGNKLNSKKRVKVEFYQTSREVITFVQDEGEQRFNPYNYFAATGENALSDHGRGLIFVELYTPGWTYVWINPGNRFKIYREKPQASLLPNEGQLGQQGA